MMQAGSVQSFVAAAIVYIVGVNLAIGAVGALMALREQIAEASRQDPVERNLQRVSHSVAHIAGTLAIVFGGYWPQALGVYTRVMPASLPAADQGLPLIAFFVVGVSVLRIRTGLRAFRFFNPSFHETTPLLRPRAIVKTAFGIGVLVYLAHNRAAYIHAGTWWALVYSTLRLTAAWCIVTGLVRLYLLRPRRAEGDNIEPPEWNWN